MVNDSGFTGRIALSDFSLHQSVINTDRDQYNQQRQIRSQVAETQRHNLESLIQTVEFILVRLQHAPDVFAYGALRPMCSQIINTRHIKKQMVQALVSIFRNDCMVTPIIAGKHLQRCFQLVLQQVLLLVIALHD